VSAAPEVHVKIQRVVEKNMNDQKDKNMVFRIL